MDGEADSGSFDMEGAVDNLAGDLFGESSESEETDDLELDMESEETSEDTAQESEEETKEELEEEVKLRAAPNSWKKEMHESFGSLTPDMQDYIEQREDQMKNGLDQDRTDSNLGRVMRDTMAPYAQAISQSGIDEPTMVKNLLGAHWKLSTAPMEERNELMNKLASNYGVTLSPQAQGDAPEVDPQIAQLQNELNGLKSEMNTSKQASLQEAKDKVSIEVNEFAEKHEYFDEVSEQLSAFINAGDTLEKAYEKAIWANPVTRQKEMDRLDSEKNAEAVAKKQVKLESAKKAKSTNVRNRDTSKAPTGRRGTMDDTMRDSYREIQNRT